MRVLPCICHPLKKNSRVKTDLTEERERRDKSSYLSWLSWVILRRILQTCANPMKGNQENCEKAWNHILQATVESTRNMTFEEAVAGVVRGISREEGVR